MTFLIHICLAVLLFFIINFIGANSKGYISLSMFYKKDTAPSLNAAIRILSPVVYLIIVSTICYSIGFDIFIHNIYLVGIYYCIFRLMFNLALGRFWLLNWGKELFFSGLIITLSYYSYKFLISTKANILPDFSTITNELWVVIILFLFQVFSNLGQSAEASMARKRRYMIKQYYYFNKTYGKLIQKRMKNKELEPVFYAIMIYENFNRPKIIRWLENICFFITKRPHTLGVMQVKSNKIISDKESLIIGIDKIVKSYKKHNYNKKCNKKEYCLDAEISVIRDYNVGPDYLYEISNLADDIRKIFYKK